MVYKQYAHVYNFTLFIIIFILFRCQIASFIQVVSITVTNLINKPFKMSMLASMSKQSDQTVGLSRRLLSLNMVPSKTISGERSTWYHDYTDWHWAGGLT